MNENLRNIWWEQLSSSVTVFRKLKESFSRGRSVMFFTPGGVPWRDRFFTEVEMNPCRSDPDRTLKLLQDVPGRPVSDVILSICTDDTKLGYWPGNEPGEYLAQSRDSRLAASFVWVYGIENKARWEDWHSTISSYLEKTPAGTRGAIFVLEYGDVPQKSSDRKYDVLCYHNAEVDRFIFCLSLVSELTCSDALKRYIAELACNIGHNPEECGKLALTGIRLAQSPQDMVPQILPEVTRERVLSGVWKAQAQIFFPVMESFRMKLINRYRAGIEGNLPIDNGHGMKINDPLELDIGNIVSIKGCISSPADKAELSFFHSARNRIAHNNIVDYGVFKKIL